MNHQAGKDVIFCSVILLIVWSVPLISYVDVHNDLGLQQFYFQSCFFSTCTVNIIQLP